MIWDEIIFFEIKKKDLYICKLLSCMDTIKRSRKKIFLKELYVFYEFEIIRTIIWIREGVAGFE